jgi:CRP/FNR family cyclic AMP-dependent transcriptional regulator
VLDVLANGLGYVAAALVFGSFYMRTMVPLRCVAIASNVAFFTYGLWLHLWPVAVLHGILLPLNIIRLRQLRQMLQRIRVARSGALNVEQLLAFLVHERHAAGSRLFAKGETGDCAFYIAQGMVELPELGVRRGPGEIFGEVAIFAPESRRTATAICVGETDLYRIDEHELVMTFHQSPVMAYALLRLVTARLVSTIEGLEAQRASAP